MFDALLLFGWFVNGCGESYTTLSLVLLLLLAAAGAATVVVLSTPSLVVLLLVRRFGVVLDLDCADALYTPVVVVSVLLLSVISFEVDQQ